MKDVTEILKDVTSSNSKDFFSVLDAVYTLQRSELRNQCSALSRALCIKLRNVVLR